MLSYVFEKGVSPFFEFLLYKLGRSLSGFKPGVKMVVGKRSPPEVRPGEEDAHEGGVGADAHGAEREEDDAGGLVLGVTLERVLPCDAIRKWK